MHSISHNLDIKYIGTDNSPLKKKTDTQKNCNGFRNVVIIE